MVTYNQNYSVKNDVIDTILVKPWIMTQADTISCQDDILKCFWESWESNIQDAIQKALSAREIIEIARESDEIDDEGYMFLVGRCYAYVIYSYYRENYQKHHESWGQAPQEEYLWIGE